MLTNEPWSPMIAERDCRRRGPAGGDMRSRSSPKLAGRKARRKGSLRELAAKKRGAKPAERNPLDAKVRADASAPGGARSAVR